MLDDRPPDDEELAAYALAADPDFVLDDDAELFWDVTGTGDPKDASHWYMPTPADGMPLLTGWRRMVVFAIVAGFVALTASGLCANASHICIG